MSRRLTRYLEATLLWLAASVVLALALDFTMGFEWKTDHSFDIAAGLDMFVAAVAFVVAAGLIVTWFARHGHGPTSAIIVVTLGGLMVPPTAPGSEGLWAAAALILAPGTGALAALATSPSARSGNGTLLAVALGVLWQPFAFWLTQDVIAGALGQVISDPRSHPQMLLFFALLALILTLTVAMFALIARAAGADTPLLYWALAAAGLPQVPAMLWIMWLPGGEFVADNVVSSIGAAVLFAAPAAALLSMARRIGPVNPSSACPTSASSRRA